MFTSEVASKRWLDNGAFSESSLLAYENRGARRRSVESEVEART